MIKRWVIAVSVALILFAGAGYWLQYVKVKEFTKEAFLMDTLIQITVYHTDAAQGRAAVQAALDEYARISALTNRFAAAGKEPGDLERINANAGIAPVTVEPDLLEIIRQSLYFGELSQGAFDITVGPLMDLWGFGQEEQQVPSDQEIAAVLPLIGYQLVEVDPERQTVYLPKPGMSLDLGGVAKGYATDQAVAKLRELGVKHALLNAGGNIYCLGTKPDGSLWRVGVRDPRSEGGMIGLVAVKDVSLVSSGDNERYFFEDGVRYSHLLDPATGKQARQLIQTTVMAASSTQADILNKPLFVKGPALGREFAAELPVAGTLLVTPEKEIIPTGAFLEEFQLSENSGYRIKEN